MGEEEETRQMVGNIPRELGQRMVALNLEKSEFVNSISKMMDVFEVQRRLLWYEAYDYINNTEIKEKFLTQEKGEKGVLHIEHSSSRIYYHPEGIPPNDPGIEDCFDIFREGITGLVDLMQNAPEPEEE
jgi:hypothetical protein